EKSPKWRLTCGYITRADYETAWTHYGLSLFADDEAKRSEHLQKGIEEFRKFTAEGYRDHPVIAECFLGQALCLYEQQHYFEVIQLLDIRQITSTNTPTETFRRMMYLRIRACRALPSEWNLAWTAQQYFEALPREHQLDTIELEMALEWVRSLTSLIRSLQVSDREFQRRNKTSGDPYQSSLQKRLELVAGVVYPYGDPWWAQLAELMEEVAMEAPFGCLARSRRFFEQKRYDQAFRQAQTGLRAMESNHQVAGSFDWNRDLQDKKVEEKLFADLRYLKAAACWNLHYWLEAHLGAREFLIHHVDDERTNQMCRSGIQAGLKALTVKGGLEPDGIATE
ncbi:unnamed protein product, partial [marine sediment metagenome]